MWNEQMKPMSPQSQFCHVILHLFAKLPWSEKWLKDENATGILFFFYFLHWDTILKYFSNKS